MAKKLHQIDWSKGQVDGDNLPGMVTEILNMDLDRPGALRARDSLVDQGITTSDAYGHARITTNPTGDPDFQDYIWDIYFTETGVVLTGTSPTLGLRIVETKAYPFDVTDLDSDLSEMVVYGERVFFCAVDSGNTPLGVCITSFIPRGRRFRDGPAVGNTVFNVPFYMQAYDWTWTVRSIDPIRPDLIGRNARYFQMMGYRDLSAYWGVVCNGRAVSDSLTAASNDIRMGISVGGCGLLATAMPEEDGLYGQDAVVDYYVQFKYGDGRFSRLSDAHRINVREVAGIWEEGDYLDETWAHGGKMFEPDSYAELRYGIGVCLFVSNSLDESVDEVRVYKKVVDYDNAELDPTDEYELVQIAKVRDDETDPVDDLGIADLVVNERFGWAQSRIYDDGSNEYRFQAFMCDATNPRYRNSSGSLYELRFSTFNGVERRGEQRISGGTLYRGSGWLKSHQCMIHIPECYGIDGGDLSISTVQVGTSGNYFYNPSIIYSSICTLMATYKANDPKVRMGLGWCAPIYGAQRASDGEYEGLSQHAARTDWREYDHDLYMALVTPHGNRPCNGELCFLDIETGTFTWEYDGAQTLSQQLIEAHVNATPLIFTLDLGSASLYTDQSFTGVAEDDWVTVKPRHIAVSGGRLFCLNGYFDGSDEETRMFYSSHGNFSAFSRYAYIDYGARGDGVGVGISTYRNKLLLHFTGATYVLDISGGIDASWRELGAISAMGSISSKSIIETPVGVFWYNGVDLVWFNGTNVNPVSYIERDRRSVRETLSSMIGERHEDVVLAYRKSLRQVWLCLDSDVMVFDIDSFAWHKYELDEIEGEIIDISGQAGDEILLTDTSTYSFDPTGTVEFDWGVKGTIDLGVPEIEKKAKRIYLDIRPDDDSVERMLELVVSGNNVSQTHELYTSVPSGVIRAQASIRGRHIELDVHTFEGGGQWRAEIESLGMSYKPKRVK